MSFVAIDDIRYHTVTIAGPKGDTGPQGPQGEAGEGLTAGGTAGQVLAKVDATDYNTEWVTPFDGDYNSLTNLPTLGTAAAADTSAFATAAQGGLADSAVQPEDLATVATTGAYSDLTSTPTLGTAAAQNVEAFATAAQGTLADSATQPGDLATVATTGDYNDLTNKPTLGTAAALNAVVLDETAYGALTPVSGTIYFVTPDA